MKLTTKLNYALLFTCYLYRTERASTATIAQDLGLDTHFLEQVARGLRLGGIVKSTRGPGGGYTLVNREVTAIQVFNAMGYGLQFLSDKDTTLLETAGTDGVAVNMLAVVMSQKLREATSCKIKDFVANSMLSLPPSPNYVVVTP